MSAGGICHYCKKRDCICEGEAMDKTNELRPCEKCGSTEVGHICHLSLLPTRTPDTPEAEAKVFRGLCDWCHEGDMVRKCGCGKQFDHVCMDSHKCSGTPPKPAVSGEGKREETLRNWKANHVSDQSFRVDGTYLPEAVERVWRLIEREKVASYDRHALLTLLAAISESPRPVDSGNVIERAREFIANFPNDNYDIDEYFVIAAAAFAEQETATLSTKLATVTAELKEAQEQIKYLANHLGVDYDTETGMYGDGSLKPNVGMLPVEANHPAPQGDEDYF